MQWKKFLIMFTFQYILGCSALKFTFPYSFPVPFLPFCTHEIIVVER
jgi:hypothetical protein